MDTEWSLSNSAYREICNTFGYPSVDLFASRINAKCNAYCSWHKDADAMAVDAFTISWYGEKFYAFPPFALIHKVLQKIIGEKATGIVIVPLWTTQAWFPIYKELLVGKPLLFEPSCNLLQSPCRTLIHPLAKQLTLLAGKLSGCHINERI